MMFLEMVQPMSLYALTEGPSQPEFNSFTPIGTSDMVDLSSGDLNYNIPIMDVGGYPLNLAYNAGVTMDQEASWVGLGWDMNVGQIARQMRGLPDDFNGDQMIYENNMKDNITVGANVNIFAAGFGVGEGENSQGKLTAGLGIKYNNYNGLGFSVSGGLSYQISDNLNVGMQMESSASEGVSASPSVSFNKKYTDKKGKDTDLGSSVGLSYNSRKGIENFTFSASAKRTTKTKDYTKNDGSQGKMGTEGYGLDLGSSVSFVESSFTPSKRVAMVSSNYMFNLNLEGEIWGFEPGFKFSGYYNSQGIDDSEKHKTEKGYGYENTYNASINDILDFNREKDRTVTRNTTTLPITNYTYDLYSVQGQGVSGMYRPYRGQVGFVFDNQIEDKSHGGSLGLEFGAGGGAHWGFDGNVTIANSKTRLWNSENPAISRFLEKTNNSIDYEKVYFKNIGGTHVDSDYSIFENQLGKYSPINLNITGSKFSRQTELKYSGFTNNNYVGKIARDKRVKRNQAVQKITRKEASRYGFDKQFSDYAKDHHTAEIRIIKEGGERYVYGRALYNTIKKEVSFDISGKQADCKTDLVTYSPNQDNSVNNKRDGDRYFNRVTTPAYAHSYLLTSVLSSDYQDLTGNGATDDDLGSYTKFKYKKNNNLYKWRVPFAENKANYEEGSKTLEKDNKGNYQYGEKEVLYIDKIETKTHIAIFEISEREDGFGVKGENGGRGTDSKMYKLDKIKLYSKPEYLALGDNATPIKTAHFEYDYSLCKGIQNHISFSSSPNANNEGGKLTLKKVYFTYKNSNMGIYTPYTFEYINNYSYDMKAYDSWGNYKPNAASTDCNQLSNAEFPYTNQNSQVNADNYARAWHLGTIHLPSGGQMTMEYESDDYSYVQNKEVMQMFKVVGAGNGGQSYSDNLFNGSNFKSHLYINLPEAVEDVAEFKRKYIRQLTSQPIYFRFLLNMTNPYSPLTTSDKYDYVTGYLELDVVSDSNISLFSGNTIAAIKIKPGKKGDGANGNNDVNPISKAGWLYGRENLSRVVYGITGEEDNKSIKAIVMDLIGAVPAIFQIFKSANGLLMDKSIASKFIPNKSWIRLMQPNEKKFGGGSRVKSLRLIDNWDVMTSNPGNDNYSQFYGQEYTYKNDAGSNSSGVASYEPIGSKENPFVKPFYDNKNSGLLLGSSDQNYVEEPLGESFFPSPKVTYSRVEVKNLPRNRKEGSGSTEQELAVIRHATGRVVTNFYTSFDYPTVVGMTALSPKFDKTPILASLLKIRSRQHLTMSQGYSVHTNDMDGKMKSQRVYAEGQSDYISGTDYNYENITNSNGSGLLNNKIITIDSKGKVAEKYVGVDYDVINDFRYNESITHTPGIKFNTAGLPLFLIFLIVPIPLPSYSNHEEKLKTAVTTKVVHSSGILRETVAYDVGSKVSTKNLAWDAETGSVLLTQTINEFNDNYYSFSYPAYWKYDGMRQAAKNLDLISAINVVTNGLYKLPVPYINEYLIDGDEIWVIPNKSTTIEYDANNNPIVRVPFKAWVVNVNLNNNNSFNLITKEGLKVNNDMLKNGSIRVIRSGFRNMQTSSMASVTSMRNPLLNDSGNLVSQLPNSLYQTTNPQEYKIVNASAIEYSDIWAGQCECNLPKMRFSDPEDSESLEFEYNNQDNVDDDPDDILSRSYNPYLYNILGNWRAKKSYAYLTGRNSDVVVNSPKTRESGFYMDFYPYYVFSTSQNKWDINTSNINKWTFASEVTKFNPYGQEVENVDALERYSSAIYGYNYRFPLAVASNAQYKEIGYDGFEDYNFSTCDTTAHLNFEKVISEYDVTISGKQAHSGRKSIRVSPKATPTDIPKAALSKKIISCDTSESPSGKKNNLKAAKK
jgi:hypothetical protein